MRERIAQRMFGAGEIQRVGRYRIERRLGSGGMGHVYAAHDEELSRRVAIKLVRDAGPGGGPGPDGRLLEEARALAQFSHPNVVQVHEVGTHAGQVYVVMELIAGQTLDLWARGRSRAEVLVACVEAGRGLTAAHAAGVLHRDIKPNNIMVGDDGRVRLVDFGLARQAPPEPSATPRDPCAASPELADTTATSQLRGTPAYIAPELYRGRPASSASDQFSLCVTIWQVLTGARPFEAQQLVAAADGRPLVAAERLRPRWLERALIRGMRPDPSARWGSVDALLAELEQRGQQRWLSAVFAGVAVLCGALATGFEGAPEAGCTPGEERFDSTWAQRREPLRAQLDARGWSPALVSLAVDGLDGHADEWISVHDGVCGPASARLGVEARARMQLCLDRGQAEFSDALDLLAEAPPTLDPRQLLAALGDPKQCTDSGRLALAPAPSPEQRDAVAGLQADLGRARLRLALAPKDALEGSASLLRHGRVLGFEPLLLELLLLDAEAARRTRLHARALDRAREALTLAKRQGDSRREFDSLEIIALVALTLLDDPERSADAIAALEGTRGLLDDDPDIEARALVARARLQRLEGRYGAAHHGLERALELAQAPLVREQAELLLANVVADEGHVDEALERYAAILDRRRALLGAAHPEVAAVDYNVGLLQLERGDLEGAREHAARALANQRAAYGASPQIAPALVLLAQIDALEGDVEAALAAIAEAKPLEAQLAPTNTERGNALRLEGALRIALEDYGGALAVFETIEAELHAGLSQRERAMVSQNIGWLLCRTGAYADARPRFEAALLRDDRDIALFAQIGLAQLDLVADAPEQARARLERVIPELEELGFEEAGDGLLEARYWLLVAQRRLGAPEQSLAALEQDLRQLGAEVGLASWMEMEMEMEMESTP